MPTRVPEYLLIVNKFALYFNDMAEIEREKKLSLHNVRCEILKSKMGIIDNQTFDTNSSETSALELAHHIRKNFIIKECFHYVKDKRVKNDEICCCGQKEACHLSEQNFDERKASWSEDYLKPFPSNAMGQVSFREEYFGSRQPSSYARLCQPEKKDNMNFMTMLKLMKLFDPYPRLAVGIIGGRSSYKMDNKSKEKFSRGLVKITSSTDAWILTEGYNYGIPQLVGDIVRDARTLEYTEHSDDRPAQRSRCIGITHWGLIKDRDYLAISDNKASFKTTKRTKISVKSGPPPNPHNVSEDSIKRHLKSAVVMRTLRDSLPYKEIFLNPDHSHFVMLDDGLRGDKCGAQPGFIVMLMNWLLSFNGFKGEDSDNRSSVPSVIVLINGDKRMIKFLLHCVQKKVPVVICRNTGKAANILADAYDIMLNLRNQSDDQYNNPEIPKNPEADFVKIRSKIKKELYEGESGLPDSVIDDDTKKAFEAVNNDMLITVIDMNSEDEFDSAILSALFKIKDKVKRQEQLKLALSWNRYDIAEEKIFGVFSQAEIGDEAFFNSLMEKALLEDKLGFVELFINGGFSMMNYVTAGVMVKLYEEAMKNDKFVKKCFDQWLGQNKLSKSKRFVKDPKHSKEQLINLNCYFRFISSMIAYQIPELNYSDGGLEQKFREPFRELFIWAMLFNHFEMAKYFWNKMDNPVMTALMGCFLLKNLIDRTSVYESDQFDEYTEAKVNFEQRAGDVLNQCGLVDNHMTSILLQNRHELWDNINCMDAAAQADCKKFLGSHMCQHVLNERWEMKIRSNWILILFGIFVPPLIPFIISFDFDDSISAEIIKKLSQLTQLYSWAKVDDGMMAMEAYKHKSPATVKTESQSKILKLKFSHFYRAPVTKFCTSTLFEVAFLLLFSYFLLFAYHDQDEHEEALEYVLHAWVFTFMLEIIRTIVSGPSKGIFGKLSWWTRLVFNCTDGIALVLYIIAFVIRMIAKYEGCPNSYTCDQINFAAKCFFAFSLFFYIIQLFNVLNVSTSLGPQLVMVGKMLQEIIYYLFLLLLFFLAFGIFHECILYNDKVSTEYENFKHIADYGFWPFINGPELDEVFTEEEREGRGCAADECYSGLESLSVNASNSIPKHQNITIEPLGEDNDGPRVRAPSWFLAAWLAAWTLLAFMLMNLLIAIFSNVYDEISKNSHEIWKYYQYQLITDFESRPTLPPPLSVFELVLAIGKYCRKQNRKTKEKRKDLEEGNREDDEDRLIGNDPVLQFEREAQAAVSREQRRTRYADSVNQLDEIYSQLSTVSDKITSFSRLDQMAESIVQEQEDDPYEAKDPKNFNGWQFVLGSIEQKPSKRKDSSSINKPAETLIENQETTKDETTGRITELEERISNLNIRLQSMQRLGVQFRELAKALSSAPVQPLQPLKQAEPPQTLIAPTLPAYPETTSSKPPRPPSAPTNKKPKTAIGLMLPVAGIGYTTVPRPSQDKNESDS